MKVIALLSGGLDSTLATKLIKEQSLEVIALNFKTPFCLCDKKGNSDCASFSKSVANNLGIELKMIYLGDEYLRILKNPKYGYGSNMNPCIDCRILLFKKAKELMQKQGASFVITGEVLGQRPMSQHKKALKLIEQESGLENLVLRPLSARLLPETIPEKKGWIDRNRLLNFSGRTRKPQINLAKEFKIKDYPCSSGGCLLTDPEFAKRIKDLMSHGELNLDNVELLKLGRHFRISRDVKLVVGRDELENKRLVNLAKDSDYLFMPSDIPGPTALGRGIFNAQLLRLASSITCRYCDLDGKASVDIVYKQIPQEEQNVLKAASIKEESLSNFRV